MKTTIYKDKKYAVIMDKSIFEELKNVLETLKSLVDTTIGSDYLDCMRGNRDDYFRQAYNFLSHTTVLCEYLTEDELETKFPDMLTLMSLETYPDIEIIEEEL